MHSISEPDATAEGKRRQVVFLSYRRDDSGGWANRLHEVLRDRFGTEKVFMDVDSIAPGQDWRQRLEDALASSSVMIVIIGPGWTGARPDGTSRITDANDIVRFEVATALNGSVLVIPALVGGAALPEADELPADLLELRDRNAIQLDPADFDADADRILAEAERLIGRQHRWRWPALAAVSVVAVVGIMALLWATGRSPSGGDASEPPETSVAPMAGDYNVAVAQFSELAADGTVSDSPEGLSLADSVFNDLQGGLGDVAGFQLEARGPTDLPSLAAPTSEERATKAAMIAEQTRADVVLYGLLQRGDDGTILQPELYLAPRQLGEAFELAGQYVLGSPIEQPVDIAQNAVARQAVRTDLLARGQSVLEILAGLANLSVGQPAEALTRFEAADAQWPDDEGRETFKLFEGNALGELGRLEDARAAYEAGLELAPGSARLLIGLGEVELAIGDGDDTCGPDVADAATLDQALDHFAQAAAVEDPPELADIRARSTFGRARTLLCLSIAGEADAWGEGAGLLRSVAAAYDEGTTRLADVAAESHHLLGLLEANPPSGEEPSSEALRAALAEHERAVEIAPAARRPERTAEYWAAVAELKTRLGDVDGARTAYDEAMATASDAQRAALEAARAALGSPTST